MSERRIWTATVLAALVAICALNGSRRPEADKGASAKETADDKPGTPNAPMLTAVVRVTNSEGRPVAGAVVKPLGMRTRKERASAHIWNDDLWGPIPSVTTGADGIAEVPVPKYVYEEMETGQVTWWVDHPKYVVFWEDRAVDDRPAEVDLQDGVLIAVRAIDDTTGRPIAAPFAMVSGTSFGDEWTLQDDGSLVSRAVSQKRKTLRVMYLPEDREEPAQFSELIDLQRQGGLALDLTVRVKPGVRVRGRLDDNVPRPVVNGRATAMVISLPENAAEEHDYESRWQWQETALVEPDGTFDLGWLSAGESLQFLAVCDGHVSRNLTPQEFDAARAEHPQILGNLLAMQDHRTWPRLAMLEGAEMTLVVPMEPTTSCRVVVIATDNRPVDGATVYFSPNQAWFQGGSQALGSGARQSRYLQETRAEGAGESNLMSREAIKDLFRRYQATSDEHGVALVTNLPALGEQSFQVEHPMLELPASQNPYFRRWGTVDLIPGKVAEVIVKLQAKGSQVIGRTP